MEDQTMEQWEQWFQEKQVERTINALKKNNFEALFVPNSKAALEEVMKQIPDGSTVGVGGSVSLAQTGILEALGKRNVHLIWPAQQAKNMEERQELIGSPFHPISFSPAPMRLPRTGNCLMWMPLETVWERCSLDRRRRSLSLG